MKKTEHTNGSGLNESASATNTVSVESTENSTQPIRKKNRRRRLPAW